MTWEETFAVIKYLQVVYPTYYSKMDAKAVEDHVTVWADIFREYPAGAVKMGVKAYVCAEPTAFPPTPGQVIEYIYRAQNPGNRSSLEVWAQVRRAVNSPRDQYEAAFAALPEVARLVLGSPQTLEKWGVVEEKAFETVVQAAFLKSYDNMIRRLAVDQKLPENMRIATKTPTAAKLPAPRPIEYAQAFDSTETRYGEAVKTALNGLKSRLGGKDT